jgi:choline dehydrogenase-like flavoprotein
MRCTDESSESAQAAVIADAEIIPTALGVNPSLTIAALALRIVDKISDALDSGPELSRWRRGEGGR